MLYTHMYLLFKHYMYLKRTNKFLYPQRSIIVLLLGTKFGEYRVLNSSSIEIYSSNICLLKISIYYDNMFQQERVNPAFGGVHALLVAVILITIHTNLILLYKVHYWTVTMQLSSTKG